MIEKLVTKKADVESLVMNTSELRTEIRSSKKASIFLLLTLYLFVGGISYWFYHQFTSPHVRFISEADTKTLIGVKNAGRIQVNTDDRTGEMIIEVYHAKK